MRSLFGRVVFHVGRKPYFWEDVVLAGIVWGDWAALEDDVRSGIACHRHLERIGQSIPQTDLEAAAANFRYDRNLIAAAEMTAWLAEWQLSVADWRAYLRRAMLRGKWAARLTDLVARYAGEPGEVAAALKADAVCSGGLGRLAWKLAGRAAVYERLTAPGADDGRLLPTAPDVEAELSRLPAAVVMRTLAGLGPEWVRERMTLLAGIEVAFREFRELVLTPAALDDNIAGHRLDWLRVDYRVLSLSSESMAREAACCVREDGMDLDAVAAGANVPLRDRSCFLEESDESLRGPLLGGKPGEVLGPVAVNGGFGLVQLVGKRLPSADDPDVRSRAEQAVLRRALALEFQERVRWQIRV